jgi:tripartite-type tricarboxylate transporter receptor subunit TctC
MSMRVMLALCLMMAGTVAAGPVRAEDYPSRAVRIIVPYAPGGTQDNVGRTYGEALTQALGQQFVIENRGGAAAAIGLEATAKAPPDGYTLAIGPFAGISLLPLIRKTSFDSLRDFALIGRVTDSILAIAVNPKVPANTLQELIAYAKANPAKLTFGSAGIGSSVHLVGEIFKRAAKVDLIHVPYRGSADAMNDLLAGNIDVYYEGAVLPFCKAGKLRCLAVTTDRRHPQYPELPTVKEIVPEFEYASWSAFVAPAGTPEPIIAKLSQALRTAAERPEIQQRLLAVGLVARKDTPADLRAQVTREIARLTPLVAELGMKQE